MITVNRSVAAQELAEHDFESLDDAEIVELLIHGDVGYINWPAEELADHYQVVNGLDEDVEIID